MIGRNIFLASKTVRHKPYKELQLLLVPIPQSKNLSINFFIRLPVFNNWKSNTYDFILVIIYWLTKMVHYEPVKVIIHTFGLAKVIFDVIVLHHSLSNLIVSDQGSVFTLKFWSSLCHFHVIKQKLLNSFHLQIDSQTKR